MLDNDESQYRRNHGSSYEISTLKYLGSSNFVACPKVTHSEFNLPSLHRNYIGSLNYLSFTKLTLDLKKRDLNKT